MTNSRLEAPAEPAAPRLEILSPRDDEDFPAEWYELADPNHFWLDWRFRVFCRLLADLGVNRRAAARALDVGCGTGALRDQIEANWQWTVDGADLRLDALRRGRSGRGTLYQYDVLERDPGLRDYDYLLLFDVLEHIHSPGPFLGAALDHLRSGGLLVVNVPALESLRSEYDCAAGHVRRYRRRELRDELASYGLDVVWGGYWGFSLIPLLWARKIALRRKRHTAAIIRSGFEPPAAWINSALRRLASIEIALLRRAPWGTSVMMAARKS